MATEKFQLLTKFFQTKIPKFQNKLKSESLLFKIIGPIVKLFNKTFLTEYITTIGTTVYWPSQEEMDRENSYQVLIHEFVHAWDFTQNPILFPLKYLFPQVLSLISLGAIGAFWSPWWLLCLLSLICLLPLPARGRSEAEMRGYTATMAVNEWEGINLLNHEEFIDFIAMQFTGMAYYKMNPDDKEVHAQLLINLSKIKDKSILETQINTPYLNIFTELKNINKT